MPLIRSTDTTKLSNAFGRFCDVLEDCIRRDIEDTRGFFPSGNDRNFNVYASSSSANSIDTNLNERLLERNPTIARRSIENLRQRVNTGLFSPVLMNMKSTILCAFELTNRGQMNRINKQQLYAFLFCLGFPTGLIAKIILDGGMAGVRNGIIKHKLFITAMLVSIEGGSRLDSIKKGFLGNENVGSVWEYRFFLICTLCQKIGGQNLFNKFVNCLDQKEVLSLQAPDYNPRNLTKNILCYGYSENNDVYRINTINLFQTAFTQQRGVRRTGQTLSRNATRTDVVNLERGEPIPSTPIIQTPPQRAQRPEAVTQSTQAQVGSELLGLVRDSKFKNTLGLEIEYWDASFDELKQGFKGAKIPLYPRYLGYHEQCNYDKYKDWRVMRDGSVSDRFMYQSASSQNGGEIVAPILVGERGMITLVKVLNVCQKVGITNNNTTGLHVHFGVKGYTGANRFEHAYDLKTIRNFFCNFIGFEKIIDAYMRRSRRRNQNYTYCASPVTDIFPEKKASDNFREVNYDDVTLAEIQQLSAKLNAMSDSEFTRWATSTIGRGKINCRSNGLAFSIELRNHGGTSEKDTILGWILFLHYLFELSKRRVATKFTWENLRSNVLPKPLASFIENRIIDMTGNIPDVYDLNPTRQPRTYENQANNNPL